MKLTRNALGMLVERYRSVLKKCHLLNILGTAALAGALTIGTIAGASAADITIDKTVTGNADISTADGNIYLRGGVNNASGTIRAAGAGAGNISAINDAGVLQVINQDKGNLKLDATGSINSGAMTVSSAKAGKDISVTGTLKGTSANGSSYGDITAAGNISAYNAAAPEGSRAYDIEAGNLVAGGGITAGDITTHGDLIADHVETFRNADDTLQAAKGSPGTVTVHGAVNLPGKSTTSRRFDIFNTVGSHNVIGDIDTGACISIKGADNELSTLTGGVLAIGGGERKLGGGSFTLANGVQANIKEVSFNVDGRKARIHGWNPKAATILDLDKFIMYNGNLLAESSWDAKYSMGVIRSVSPDAKRPGVLIGDGNIAIGANAMVGLGAGATRDWLYGLMKTYTGNDAPTKDGVKSVLALNQPLELQNGFHVFMNGDLNSPNLTFPASTTSNDSPFYDAMSESGTFTQGANTMLVINGANDKVHYTTVKNARANQIPGAISYVATDKDGAVAQGDAKIEAGAKLLITGAQTNETYVVLGEGFDKDKIEFVKDDAGKDTAWKGENLVSDNPMVKLERSDSASGGTNGSIHARLNSASNVFPGLDDELVAAIDTAATDHEIGTSASFLNNGQRGTQFLSRALTMASPFGGNDPENATKTIESAARMAVIGAVPQMTLAANDAAGAAVTQRTSLANPSSSFNAVDEQGNLIGPDQKNGFALWILPLYQSTNGFGMEAGNFDYDFNGALGGVAVGADWTFENAFRAGLLFNIGGGYARGTGDFNETTNDMNFWGIGAYAGWSKNGFGLTADVNYTSTFNELKQDLPSGMGWNELKSDINAWALSAGLRAEYIFQTDALDIIPHIGARFINLNVDSYDIKNSGTVIDGDSITQNIWKFPIGVSLTKDIVMDSGWHVKPLLDLNVTPAAGDVEAKSKIRFTGTGTEAELDTKMMDYITYGGTAGIEFGKDNFSFSVNYNGQFGAESSAHGVFGMFRYEF